MCLVTESIVSTCVSRFTDMHTKGILPPQKLMECILLQALKGGQDFIPAVLPSFNASKP